MDNRGVGRMVLFEQGNDCSTFDRLLAVALALEQMRLCDGPVDKPTDWLTRVNRAESKAELELLRESVARGRPYGQDAWRDRVIRKLGMENTMRPRGQPKKVQR